MEWNLESSLEIEKDFMALKEDKRLFSNVIAISFDETPVEFPIVIVGTSTCPGCRSNYPFNIEAYKSFGASNRISCKKSTCGDEYDVYAAYKPGWDRWGEDPPIYVYSVMYTTLKGQQLTPILLKIQDVKISSKE
jgi:hypothetical protein